MDGAQTERPGTSRQSQPNILTIDAVVSSQPELGPTPPDGGYGWIILGCALFTQIMIPSLIYTYGVILLFVNLSDSYKDDVPLFRIYDRGVVIVPIVMTLFSLLYKEGARTLVLMTSRPRIVSISGVLLVAAGLLLSNFDAESADNDILLSLSSGLILGVGYALTNQQCEILIRHYFRNKLPIVLTVYKTGPVLGYIVMPLVMSTLLTSYGASMSLIIFAGIILQQCVLMLFITRPTYIVNALKQNYKVLDEEDDDETIYTHVRQNETNTINNANTNTTNETNTYTNVINNDTKNNQINNNDDDLDDEHVIATFDNRNNREITLQPTPNLTRYESNNQTSNPFRVSFDQIERNSDPRTLYRETTVANETNNEYTFSFDPPTSGTLRRTANVKRNITVFVSILKDYKFYAYTQILLCQQFSNLVLGALFPAYISQQLPYMEMTSVVGMAIVIHIGAMCLTLVTTYVSLFKHKVVMRFSSVVAAVGFIGLSSSGSKGWLTIWGILSIFATNSLHIALRPIYNRTSTEFEPTAISQTSSVLAGIIIFFIMMVHNHTYSLCFRIAAFMNLFTPFIMYKY